MSTPPPIEGITWCADSKRWVFMCVECDRCQGYAPAGQGGGVTEAEVELIGWRKIDGEWLCPYCTGNTSNLQKVFERSTEPASTEFQVYGPCMVCEETVTSEDRGTAMRKTPDGVQFRHGACAPLAGNDPDE